MARRSYKTVSTEPWTPYVVAILLILAAASVGAVMMDIQIFDQPILELRLSK